MFIPTRPQNAKKYSGIQKNFFMKINSSPTQRNLHMCPCSTINNKISAKQLEIIPCWVSNPWQDVATVTVEPKRTLSLSIPHIPKRGTTICFPYAARQVSNSWHTQDGFFLHEWKGKVKWSFHPCWKKCCWIYFSVVQFTQKWLSQHMTLLFEKNKGWTRIDLDFQKKNNKKINYHQFHLASEYWLHKYAKIY